VVEAGVGVGLLEFGLLLVTAEAFGEDWLDEPKEGLGDDPETAEEILGEFEEGAATKLMVADEAGVLVVVMPREIEPPLGSVKVNQTDRKALLKLAMVPLIVTVVEEML